MMLPRFWLACFCLVASSLAGSLPLKETVGVHLLSDDCNHIEVAVTDDTLDSDGLLVSASIDLKLEVLEGIAMINGQYAMPIGLTHIQMKADVKKYVMSPVGRKRHNMLHDIDVAIAARVAQDEKSPHKMRIALQLIEYDGKTREIEHTTLVSVSLNEKDEEVMRTIDPKSKSLTLNEKFEAAKHKVDKFVDRAKETIRNDAQSAVDRFMTKWDNSNDYEKVSIVLAISIVSLIVIVGFAYLVKLICCYTPGNKLHHKGSNYKKNLGGMRVNIMPANQFKGVKYTLLKNEAA